MIYDLKNEAPEVIPNFKGGQREFIAKIHTDGVNKIIHGTLPPQATIGRHTHETDSEIIYILSGHGSVLDDNELLPLEAGQCHYCPQGHTHSLINDSEEDLVFFAVVPTAPQQKGTD